MGEDFSGSRTVTSRNPLLHKGATKGTQTPRLTTSNNGPNSFGGVPVVYMVYFKDWPDT